MAKTDLTAQRLRELLHYDPQTGEFTWKVKTNKRVVNGQRTGCKLSQWGYRRVGVAGGVYQAHRLAWFYVHGVWPSGEIDHMNGDKADNRLANLRDVPAFVNGQNQRKARSNSKTGVLGVSSNGKRWRSRLILEGKEVHLGTFDTQELAHAAYIEAKRRLHEGCTI